MLYCSLRTPQKGPFSKEATIIIIRRSPNVTEHQHRNLGTSNQLPEEESEVVWQNFFSESSEHCNGTSNLRPWSIQGIRQTLGKYVGSQMHCPENEHSSLQQCQIQGFKYCDVEHESERLIQMLCNQGQLDGAIDAMSRVKRSLSEGIYLCILRLCYKSKTIHQVKKVLDHLRNHETTLRGLLGDYLVVTLAKCGAVDDARHISSSLQRRTVFSWTAMISGYVFTGRFKEALKTHEDMLKDAVEPNSYTFVCLLKACGCLQELEKGKELHDCVRLKGLEQDVFVGSTLVSMYGKCGAVTEAELVFNALSQRNIVSWNAMLATYISEAQWEKTILLYRQMLQEDVGQDQHTLLFVLQASIILAEKEKALSLERRQSKWMSFELAYVLHANAEKSKLVSNVFVGSTLISLYSKLSAVVEASHVFLGLSHFNVVSWTAMLAVYIEACETDKALRLYRQMHMEGFNPDRLASVTALQACCSLAEKGDRIFAKGIPNRIIALEIGQAILYDARLQDYASDAFFLTTLLSMYGKCGAVEEAENTFTAVNNNNVVIWSAMLAVYVEQGEGVKALKLYMQMLKEGINPDKQTIVCVLQALCNLAESEESLLVEGRPQKVKSLEIGYSVHADSRKLDLLYDVFVCNTLVNMYGKCGAITEAEQTLTVMSHRNVVSWTAMLSAYHEQGEAEKALQMYAHMQWEGVKPDQLACIIILQACGLLAEKDELALIKGMSPKLIALEIGNALHADVENQGFTRDAFVCTALLNMYGKCGAVKEAEDLFEALEKRDIVSWSAMLSAYVDQHEGEKALQLYRQMHEEDIPLDQLSCVIALQACSNVAEKEQELDARKKCSKTPVLDIGRALHAYARKKGFVSDILVSNTLINMYGKCGVVTEAEHVFATIPQLNIVSWNALLSLYSEQGESEKALCLYKELQRQGIIYDDVTVISILRSCSISGNYDICNELHFDVVSAGYEHTPSVAASLIHAYGNCSKMIDCHSFFDQLSKPLLASWNACIAGYAVEGNSVGGLGMFEKLINEAEEPDVVTFTSVISACSHCGFVNKGVSYFASMSCDFGILPQVKHYGSILDLLARAGDFKRVEDVLGNMTVEADQTIWLCLLGACRTHSNLELAKHAFLHAVNQQPNQSAAYVMMANVFSDTTFQH